MKERLKSIVNAARILQQLPGGDRRQWGIKNQHLATLFRDIGIFMFDMEFSDTPQLPNMSLSTCNNRRYGRVRSFSCSLVGYNGFDVTIKVTVKDSIVEVAVITANFGESTD